jgi:hypothetical protein
LANVTIFGGSEPRPGQPAYDEALRLGYLLAKAGFTVVTGGYIGTMEAVSRGAVEAGGHVIGVTCDEIEAFRPLAPNAWVKEEQRCATLRERIYMMMQFSQAAIALPGGSGTLAEVALMWNHLYIQALSPRPLILVGAAWQAVLDLFITNFSTYVPETQRRLVQFAPDISTAVDQLKRRENL